MTETYDNGWVSVSIPVKTAEDVSKLFDLEKKEFWDRGISFDTGTGFGFRDWELDWSLEGAPPSYILEVLDREGIEYEYRQVPDGILDD